MIRLLTTLAMITIFSISVFAFQVSLDTTFDSDGMVTTDIGYESRGAAVAVQIDGKTVASGYIATGGGAKMATVRYNLDGSLDSSFSYDGIAIDYVGYDGSAATSVAIQTDGKIVVAGYTYRPDWDFALIRYNPDGSLDSSFGSNGKVRTDFFGGTDFLDDIKIQSDGKILAGGRARESADTDFALARYNTDGSLDTSFGIGGKVTTDFSSTNDIATSVALQSNGKIVVSGITLQNVNISIAVARYFSDGSLDTTLDGDGKVITSIVNSNVYSHAVAVDAVGNIFAAGRIETTGNRQITVVKYSPDGSLDTRFGSGGITTTLSGVALDIYLQSDGNILVAGWSTDGRSGDADFIVQKLKKSGSLDWRWGRGGSAWADFGNNDYGSAMAIDTTQNKIVVAGSAEIVSGGDHEFAVARFSDRGVN